MACDNLCSPKSLRAQLVNRMLVNDLSKIIMRMLIISTLLQLFKCMHVDP